MKRVSTGSDKFRRGHRRLIRRPSPVFVFGGRISASLLLLLSSSFCMKHKAPLPIHPSSERGVLHVPLISHHHLERRRRLEANTGSSIANLNLTFDNTNIDPLYQGLGTHYVDLWVGCPNPVRQTVIVDTGSGVTAFPCSECVDCGGVQDDNNNSEYLYHTDRVYPEKNSSCYHKVSCEREGCQLGVCKHGRNDDDDGDTCRVSRHYAEGSSWHAVEVIDKVYSGGSHESADMSEESEMGFDLRFGCQTSLTGLFKTQMADGIMGLKREKGSYPVQLYKAGKIARHQFSLCFTQQPTASRSGTGAGAMILGGSGDPRTHATPMVYATMIDQKNYDGFVVHLERIYLRTGGGESVVSTSKKVGWKNVWANDQDMNGPGVILDSGTTFTYLSKRLNPAFTGAWKAITGKPYTNNAIKLTDDELAALPTILFQMTPHKASNDDAKNNPSREGIAGSKIDSRNSDSILVAFPPSQYMHYNGEKDTYTSHLFFSGDPNRRQVLGANFMSGKDVTFDVELGRVGFAESDCDYAALGNPNFENITSASQESSTGPDTSTIASLTKEPTQSPILPTTAPAAFQPTAHATGPDIPNNGEIASMSSEPRSRADPQEQKAEKSVLSPVTQSPSRVPEPDGTPSVKSSDHSFVAFCNTQRACRGYIAAGSVGLIVALALLVACKRRRQQPRLLPPSRKEYLPAGIDDDDDDPSLEFGEYRDNPEPSGSQD